MPTLEITAARTTKRKDRAKADGAKKRQILIFVWHWQGATVLNRRVEALALEAAAGR